MANVKITTLCSSKVHALAKTVIPQTLLKQRRTTYTCAVKIQLIISGDRGHSASTTSNRSPTFLGVVKSMNANSCSKRMNKRDIISRCEILLLWRCSSMFKRKNVCHENNQVEVNLINPSL